MTKRKRIDNLTGDSVSPSTYDLMAMARTIVDALEVGDGEVTPELDELLGEFVQDASTKVEALFYVHQRLQSERDLLLAERDRIDARRERVKSDHARVKALATALLMQLRDLGGLTDVKEDGSGGKLRTPRLTAWLQRTPPRVVGPDLITSWPRKWTRTRHEPDKRAALAELKEIAARGDDLPPGFALESDESSRWR